jgi:bifunctional non-homologous end joining protein LigD
LPIAGFALRANKFDGIGRRRGDELIYVGKVDHGSTQHEATGLQTRLKPLIRKNQPYKKHIGHKGVWVEPTLLAEIEYRAKPASEAASFLKRLREDL